MWDAAQQYCTMQDTLTVTITDSFIATVDDDKTREQLLKLQAMGKISLDISENAELVEDPYEKKKIKLNPRCILWE